MIKKLLTISLILITIIFCSNKSFAVEPTQNYYDVYQNMQNDVAIARTWAMNNFANWGELKQYLIDKGYTTSSSINNRVYIALTNSYNNPSQSAIAISFLSASNYSTVTTSDYYGVTSPCFTTTGTFPFVRFSLSSTEEKQIISFTNISASATYFAGYYYMKVDVLFSGNDIIQDINSNVEELESQLLNTNEFLQDGNSISDDSISDYSNEIDSSVSSIVDDFDNSSSKDFITRFLNLLLIDESSDFTNTTLDLSFSAFGNNYNIVIPSTITEDFLLNNICHGNTLHRNQIRNAIQSLYYLFFALFFVKKFYSIFKHIITLNFDTFEEADDLVNML